MANYHAEIESPKTVEEAFDYMVDFRRAVEWDENTKSVKLLEGDPSEPGARYEVVTGFGGRDLTLVYETVEVERPGRVVFESSTGMAKIRDTITFDQAGAGSRVAYDANISPNGLAKLLDPVFALIFKRVGDRAAASLRSALGAE